MVTDAACCPKYTNEYLYDIDGTICGLKYNGTAYYFYKNLQGDVIAIADDTGAVKATYTYDAWGKCTTVSDTSGCNIAEMNPFRYRGYYYDTETDLYYLQSRYYNPEVGRFINADEAEVIIDDRNIISTNLLVYCRNNPVNERDHNGNLLLDLIGKFALYAVFGIIAQFASDLIEFLYRKLIKKENPSFPISSIGDFIGSAVSWGMCAFDLFNKKVWSFLAPFLPVFIKYATYIITGASISWYALLVDLLAAFVAGIISVALNKKMKEKLSKVRKKAGNRYSDYQKYFKKQINIKIGINKKFMKVSFTIVIATGIIQLLLNLLLKS